MNFRKSALTSLVLAAALVGAACEEKSEGPPPPPTISITPSAPITLAVGQQATVSGVVTGLTTNAVTYSSSVTAVATVNPTTGVVTAVAPGTTTITAQSTEQANLRASVQVTVTAAPGPDPGTEPAPPTISLSRITQGGTNQPVNVNNVSGQIDVVLNLNIPVGNTVQAVDVLIGNRAIRCLDFSGTGSVEGLTADASASDEVVCSIDTAQLDPSAGPGEPLFLNGPVIVSGRILMGDGSTVTSTNQIQIILNNQNYVTADLTWSRGCENSEAAGVAPAGSRWCGGDLTIDLLQVNFRGTDRDVTEAVVSITTSGNGANGLASCSGIDGGAGDTDGDTDGMPDCATTTVTQTDATADGNAFQVVFAGGTGVNTTTAAGANDIAGFEDIVTITVNSITAGGEAGPVCINPDAVGNIPPNCGPGGPGSNVAFFETPVRIDNLAPRATLLDITPATLGCAQSACYVNDDFDFTTDNDDFIVLEDWGVDAQTAQLAAGSTTAAMTEFDTGADLAETETPNQLLRAQTIDKLENTRTYWATTNATAPATTATGANQRFGMDRTDPTVEDISPDLDGDTDNDDANETVTVQFEDAGTGPSGFNATPVRAKLERIQASGTTCYNPDTGAALTGTALACGTGSTISTDGTVVFPEGDGYWRLTVFVVDEAGNASASESFVYLDDEVAPTVAGIVSPSTIEGGTQVTFNADLTDNVDLGDALVSIGYTDNIFFANEGRRTIGTYGPTPLTTSDAGAFTFTHFIASMEETDGLGAPNGNILTANAVNYAVRDVAGVELDRDCPAPPGDVTSSSSTLGNCTTRQNNNIGPNVAAGNTFDSFVGMTPLLDTFTFDATPDAPDNAGNAEDPDADEPVVTFTAVATGDQGTFGNPFDFVNFYWYDAAEGRWIRVATDATGVATDDDVQNVRRWTWTATFEPSNLDDGANTFWAVGVRDGRGLRSNQDAVLIDND